MTKTLKLFRPAIMSFIIMTVICGLLYTMTITGIAQLVFPNQANGSIMTVTLKDGSQKDFGSSWIAQEFISSKYMIGRPMGTSNLSPVSKEQEAIVQSRIEWLHSLDPNNLSDIPMDLVTASGSGVDPHITPMAAEYQVSRIARVRGISENDVRAIIRKYTTNPFLGFWGEPAVNVLKVNLALDGLL